MNIANTSTQQIRRFRPPGKIARWLAEPLQPLSDVDRRNARLLAWLTLPVLILVVFPYVLSGFQSRFLVAIVGLTAAYGCSRTRWYRVGVILFLVAMAEAIFARTVRTDEVLTDSELGVTFMWLVPALIVGATLLTIRAMYLLTSLFLVAEVVVLIGLNQYSLLESSLALSFTLTCSLLILIFMGHRRRLEQVRQSELRETTEAMVRAQESDQIKSQFLASMSHELRTPLNAIMTFNQLLAMGSFGPVNEEQVDHLEKSLHSARHLLALINDVLDITKIQSGMMKLFLEDDFDIAREIELAAASVDKMLLEKDVKLVREFDAALPIVTCDKRRMRQVFFNLLSNAVKFTETGTITIKATNQGDQVLFAFIDTGPGISPEEQALVFEPFIQTETGRSVAAGTGLGLPISKQLVEAHGGRIWVESAVGQGAAFYVTLPTDLHVHTESEPDS